MEALNNFYHCKTQWIPISCINSQLYYKNIYSGDESEIHQLKAIDIRELNLYNERQNYNHPFTPKIYKSMINSNYNQGHQILFNVGLLIQRVSKRLTSQNLSQFYNVRQKIVDLLKGLMYLGQKYGFFHINRKLIGWTNLGVIKVWINSNFASNTVEFECQSEKKMVEQTISFLEQCQLISVGYFKEDTFQNLISSYQRYLKIYRLQNSTWITFPKSEFQTNELKSKKNITFSYSNKQINILNKSKKIIKCNSIRMDEQQVKSIKYLPSQKIFSKEESQTQFESNDSEIVFWRPNDKKSIFKPILNQCKTGFQDIKIKNINKQLLKTSSFGFRHGEWSSCGGKLDSNNRKALSSLLNCKTSQNNKQMYQEQQQKLQDLCFTNIQNRMKEMLKSNKEQQLQIKNDLDALLNQEQYLFNQQTLNDELEKIFL